MPNWCDNVLILTHDDPKMIVRAVRAFKKGEFLHEFIPVPAALKETIAGSYGDSQQQSQLEAATAHNNSTYGYGNWYDFCINEWGTKWDVGGKNEFVLRHDKNNVSFRFQSAWAPPVDAYRKLLDLGFSIDAKYYEPGVGFAGWFYDGNDDNYNLSECSVEELESVLPEELENEFGILESMREWESEKDE